MNRTLFVGLMAYSLWSIHSLQAETVVIHPKRAAQIGLPKNLIKVTPHRSPRVGDLRKKHELSNVSIQDARPQEQLAAVASTSSEPRKVPGVQANWRGNVIRLLADAEVEGQEFDLKVDYLVRVEQYRRIHRLTYDGRFSRTHEWVCLPNEETSRNVRVVVALGTQPTLMIPEGANVRFDLPGVARVKKLLRRPFRKRATANLLGDQSIVVTGKKAGKDKFPFEYELGGKRLRCELPVIVVRDEKLQLPVSVVEGEAIDVQLTELGELAKLRSVALLTVAEASKPGIAGVSSGGHFLTVSGEASGWTNVVVMIEGLEKRKRRVPKRYVSQVTLLINVGEKSTGRTQPAGGLRGR